MPKTKTLTKTDPKLEKLSKAQLIQMVQDAVLPLTDPEKYKELIRKTLPDFAKEVETAEIRGTATFEASQEMMLVVFDCLRRYHHFRDADLTQLNKELTDVLRGVKEFETEGLSMLSMNSIQIVGDNVEDLTINGLLEKIAKVRMKKAEMDKTGLKYPKIAEKPFLGRGEK